ncbi:type II secretion system F family protein [uncultured Aureimonas sp.]|uniref:type II secretion system F family protein n=1 Tax=uncultured Aureimonas sp. TaxID=1604662 RepID=UPI0025E8B9D3|nr:type II secretion system F family protein [uncultured Aureimonas sp.]
MILALLFALLVSVSLGALTYAILEPKLQTEKNARSRLGLYKQSESEVNAKRVARDRLQEVAKRRKSIQSSLDELDGKQKARNRHTRNVPIDRRISQAGLKLSMRAFVSASIALGLVMMLVALVMGAPLLLAAGLGVVGGLGVPRWFLTFMRKRRQKKFTEEFANAIDVVVRGIRSGLPLNDTLRMVAAETPEPVRSEFARIVEGLQIGLSMTEAVERLYQNMPLPETNFFAIVVSIQSQAGGNLGEALSNLSRVLRERKRMKGKIQAMSMEAKASGAIIGALPFIVGFLVYLTSPDYIGILFATSMGNIVLACAGFWMSIGIVVMRNMINFDF